MDEVQMQKFRMRDVVEARDICKMSLLFEQYIYNFNILHYIFAYLV
jgi:hypothetical protein